MFYNFLCIGSLKKIKKQSFNMFNNLTIKNFLSQEECDKILKYSLNNLTLEPGEIGSGKIVDKIRKSSIAFNNYDIEFSFIKDRIKLVIDNEIRLKGFDLFYDGEEYQFTEYKTGEHYGWHTDSANLDFTRERYCSVVIQLNDEYQGGELEMKDNDDNIVQFEKGIGNLFVFLSDIKHRVKPVTDGVRYSLVNWIAIKKIENFKKTLL